MNTTLVNPPAEARWKTYLKAIGFVLPAVTAWFFVCIILIPKFKEVCANAPLDMALIGWLWRFPLFLVSYGRELCLGFALTLVLLELFASKWAPYRRFTVSLLVWVVNVAVMVGLAALLTVAVIAGSSLMQAKPH